MNSGVRVKLVDFGIFGSNGGRVGEKQTAGSLKFMAPEVLLGKTESTPKIDIWALGCILHALVLGSFPFADKNPEVLKEKILKREIQMPYEEGYCPIVLDLIEQMLEKDPDQRISLFDIFRHSWMNDS